MVAWKCEVKKAALLVFKLSIVLGVFYFSKSSLADSSLQKLTLEQAVQQGLEHNLELQAIKYNISLAQADELTAGLWNNPILSVITSLIPFTKNWDQTNAGGPAQTDIFVNYPIDFSGKISNSAKNAAIATKEAEAQFQDAIRQKVLDIRLTYLELLELKEQIQLNDEVIQELEPIVKKFRKRKGGDYAATLHRLFAAERQYRTTYFQLQSARRIEMNRLAILMGRSNLGEDFSLATTLHDFKTIELPQLEEGVRFAQAQRPDLQALRLTKEKAASARTLALARKWDNLILGLGVSTQFTISPAPGDPTSFAMPQVWSGYFGLTLPMPLFNRNQGNVLRAEYQEAQVDKQLEVLNLAVRQEIENLGLQLGLHRKMYEEFEAGELESSKNFRKNEISQLRRTESESDLSEYLETLFTYESVYSAYYSVLCDYRGDIARLNSAFGKDMFAIGLPSQ